MDDRNFRIRTAIKTLQIKSSYTFEYRKEFLLRSEVVAQLTEWWLPKSADLGSNTVIEEFSFVTGEYVENMKRQKDFQFPSQKTVFINSKIVMNIVE